MAADGSEVRWDGSAREAVNRPQSMASGTLRGDGFGVGGVVLPRRIDMDWPDMRLYDTVVFQGEDGSVAYEGRIAGTPRSFDAGHSISVNCAGWMSHAKDRKMSYLGVLRESGIWGELPLAERIRLATASKDIATLQWATDGEGLALAYPAGTLAADAIGETWFTAPTGVKVGLLQYQATNIGVTGNGLVGFSDSDSGPGDTQAPTIDGTLRTLTPTTARRHVYIQASPTSGTVVGAGWLRRFDWLALFGDHGLELRDPLSAGEPSCLYVSDVIRDIFARYCPKLSTAGVQDTTYPVAQIAYLEDTFPYDALLDMGKWDLWLPAVWENKTLHRAPADLTKADWVVRLSDHGVKVDLQGDSTDELAAGIAVTYTDVLTGRVETLRPDNYPELLDPNVENPATRHGIDAWPGWTVSFPCTADDALQLGRAFLAELNQPKGPGTISVTGHVRDGAGHWQPYWKMRAGETIAIEDHPNDRPRLIVETDNDHSALTCRVAVDSTFHRVDAYMDRVLTHNQANSIG